jgi:fumarylacetoacetate (FAA) hydrolase
MKLATLKDGSRDGLLAVVSRDLTQAHFAAGIATTLQQVLDDWNFVSPQLEDLYATLNGGKARHAFEFNPRHCMAPLPRAYQWADGSAYLNHVELVRRARNAEVPASFYEDPLMYQGGSDDFIGPCDDARFASTDWGIDFESEVAVVTGDVAMGTDATGALDSVRLLMLVNDWSLRNLIPAELAKGFGFLQSKPATAFSPVAVTLDEVGQAWQGGRLHLRLESRWNGKRVGYTWPRRAACAPAASWAAARSATRTGATAIPAWPKSAPSRPSKAAPRRPPSCSSATASASRWRAATG